MVLWAPPFFCIRPCSAGVLESTGDLEEKGEEMLPRKRSDKRGRRPSVLRPMEQAIKLEGGKLVLSVLPDFINLAHLVVSLPGLLRRADR